MDIDFEIEDEGFDDEDGEQITIGTPQPDNTLMSLFNDTEVVHVISSRENEDRKPYEVLIDLVSTFCEVNDLDVKIERGPRHA